MNWLILIFLGIAWGLTFPLSKIAAVSGGSPLGLTFWQNIVSGLILLVFVIWKYGGLKIDRSLYKFILVVTFLAGIFPNIILYTAAFHLDAGVLSISVSVVPMFTYILALCLGLDKFGLFRCFGLIIGFIALLILLLPENSLPERSDIPWVLLSLLCALFYSLENIYIDKIKPENFGPIRIACALSITTAFISFPLSVVSGQFFIPTFDNPSLLYSLLGIGAISAVGYSTFIFLIGNAGSVFAGQTGYLVTFFGIVWGIFLLSEIHSYFVWTSFLLIMVGIFFVRPKEENT